MSDYRASIAVGRPADDVFDFVSCPQNMHRYLDSVVSVRSESDGILQIVGEIDGREFQTDGWFEVDAHHLMMRWGALGGASYVGHMTVTPMDEGRCKLEVHLLFAHGGGNASEQQEDRVWNVLDASLDSIKSISEQTPQMLSAFRNSYMA